MRSKLQEVEEENISECIQDNQGTKEAAKRTMIHVVGKIFEHGDVVMSDMGIQSYCFDVFMLNLRKRLCHDSDTFAEAYEDEDKKKENAENSNANSNKKMKPPPKPCSSKDLVATQKELVAQKSKFQFSTEPKPNVVRGKVLVTVTPGLSTKVTTGISVYVPEFHAHSDILLRDLFAKIPDLREIIDSTPKETAVDHLQKVVDKVCDGLTYFKKNSSAGRGRKKSSEIRNTSRGVQKRPRTSRNKNRVVIQNDGNGGDLSDDGGNSTGNSDSSNDASDYGEFYAYSASNESASETEFNQAIKEGKDLSKKECLESEPEDLEDSDEDFGKVPEDDDMSSLVGFYTKIIRSKNRWTISMNKGALRVERREYVFKRGFGEAVF